MRIPRVYVDTSVLGGYFDPEFARWSRALVEDFHAARLQPFLSELLAAELEGAPEPVRALYAELRPLAGPTIVLSPDALDLAARYAAHQIVPARYRNDMLHIELHPISWTPHSP